MALSPGERLRTEYGMRGALTLKPEEGGIRDLLCDMDQCYCPKGRGHFVPLTVPLTDWMPSLDHYPKLRMFGGTRRRGNIRLAHRACNRLAYGTFPGHTKRRWKAALAVAQWHKDFWRESAETAEQRAAWEGKWREMRGTLR